MGSFIEVRYPLCNYRNIVVTVGDIQGEDREFFHVCDALLVPALPSIISSTRFLKEQLMNNGDKLTAMWEELREQVLAPAVQPSK
jgi:hypothetical protein